MHLFILAADATPAAPPGDGFMTAALVMLAIALLITAITTWVVTPRGDHD
jgi:antibiotic biosynthesis monooxygenase (ABM) superfamily enzyme